jgi:hypothetical protein
LVMRKLSPRPHFSASLADVPRIISFFKAGGAPEAYGD